MKIALPVDNGHLHGHFGGCRQFALVEADPEKKVTLRTDVVPAPEHQPGLFPRWLREQGVQVVIAGGIGRRALDILAQEGITVRVGPPDARVEDLVSAFLNGELVAIPEGCGQHGQGGHHHHPHHHGHEQPN